MSYSVFFSHSGHDRAVGQQFAAQLQHHGIHTYLFQNDSQPGRPLASKIRAAIEQSKVVIVLLTKAGDASRYVHQEIGIALALKKLIIPVVAETIKPTLGMLTGLDYLQYDAEDPDKTSQSLTTYLDKLKRQDQWKEALTIAGLLLFALIAIILLSQGGGGTATS